MDKIAVVGLGLIGGSLSRGFKDNGFRVIGIDSDERVIDFALSKGIIDEGYLPGEEREVIKDVSFIALAIYPGDIPKYINGIKSALKGKQIIFDVGGLKSEIVSEVNKILGRDVFIGSHPMAGLEKSGIENSDSNIFKGAKVVLTPRNNSQETIDRVKNLYLSLGVGEVNIISPKDHDRIIGITSHLPHILALSLLNFKDEKLDLLVGGSFRDATRVGDINSELWSELLFDNREFDIKVIDELIVTLERFKIELKEENKGKLKKLIEDMSRR